MCTQASYSLGRVKERKRKGKGKEKRKRQNIKRKRKRKEKIKKKKQKLERPNPDFRVHQSPRGPGASPVFNSLIGIHLLCKPRLRSIGRESVPVAKYRNRDVWV